jgi:ADP-ribose pyrophosphatase YjhB (NUDIX family)
MDLDALALRFGAELDGRPCFLNRVVPWLEGPVRQRLFLDDGAFPTELVTSVRALVFRGSKVVVVRDSSGARHIHPGGHIEHAETIDEALRRELLEETGWRVGEVIPFGFRFVEPVARKALPAARQWRGSVHLVFIAEATSYHRSARDLTQIEVGSSLVSIGRALREIPEEAAVLRSAIQRRRRPPPKRLRSRGRAGTK